MKFHCNQGTTKIDAINVYNWLEIIGLMYIYLRNRIDLVLYFGSGGMCVSIVDVASQFKQYNDILNEL